MLFLVATAVERAMKLQEVILRALSGALTWVQAADILGIDPRSLRRWRARYEVDQQLGLYERRQLPSPCKAPVGVVQQILRLYRETYRGFNVRPCHYLLRRDHGMTLSYSFVRLALQEAGLVAKRRGAVAIRPPGAAPVLRRPPPPGRQSASLAGLAAA
jgi:transposase-like protein